MSRDPSRRREPLDDDDERDALLFDDEAERLAEEADEDGSRPRSARGSVAEKPGVEASAVERAARASQEDRARGDQSVVENLARSLESAVERARGAERSASEAMERSLAERRSRRRLVGVIAALLVLAVVAVAGTLAYSRRAAQLELERDQATARLSRSIDEIERLRSRARASRIVDVSSWEAAVDAADAARALVFDGAPEELAATVERLAHRAEVELRHARGMKRLGDARSIAGLESSRADRREADAAYATIFAELFGLAFDEQSILDAAALLRERASVDRFALHLALWSSVARFERADTSRADRLLAIAEAVDPHAHRTTIRRALSTGRSDEIERLAASPEFREAGADTTSLLAVALRHAQKIESSRRVLRLAIEREPQDFWWNFELGRSLLLEAPRDLDEARARLEVARVLRPEVGSVHRMLALAIEALGEPASSLAILREGVERVDDSWSLRLSVAQLLLRGADLDPAAKELEALLASSIDPRRRARVLASLGGLAFLRGDDLEGLERLNEALALDPLQSESREILGIHSLREGRLDRAVVRLQEAVALEPRSAPARRGLGQALLERADDADLVTAIEPLRDAVALDPDDAQAWALLADAEERAGAPARAIRAWGEVLLRDSSALEPHRRLLVLGEHESEETRAALLALLPDLERAASPRGADDANAPLRARSFACAWLGAGSPESFGRAVQLALEEEIERLAPEAARDPANGSESELLVWLGRVQSRRGDRRAAVRHLEAALAGPDLPAAVRERARRQLELERAAILPDLATYRSIDDAVRALPEVLDLARAHARFDAFSAFVAGKGASDRIDHLDARLLLRAGRVDEARGLFLAVARRDTSSVEPLLGLWECDRAQARSGLEALDVFHARLRKLVLPEARLPVPALSPGIDEVVQERAVSASPGSTPIGAESGAGRSSAAGDRGAAGSSPPESESPREIRIDPTRAVTLRATPFAHPDPRVEYAGSRWRVFELGANGERVLILERRTDASTRETRIPPLASRAGAARELTLEFLDSAGRWAAAGAPWRLLADGDMAALETVALPLGAIFNVDVVSDPGDDKNDALDERGHTLLVDGLDARGKARPGLSGLPRDRRVGEHRLEKYSGTNALQLSKDSAAVTIPVPAGRYAVLRLLVSGVDGDASLPIELRFADGQPVRRELSVDDGFDRGEQLGANATLLRDDVHRTFRERIEHGAGVALFEVLVELDTTRELRALRLLPQDGARDRPPTRIHIFSILGDRVP